MSNLVVRKVIDRLWKVKSFSFGRRLLCRGRLIQKNAVRRRAIDRTEVANKFWWRTKKQPRFAKQLIGICYLVTSGVRHVSCVFVKNLPPVASWRNSCYFAIKSDNLFFGNSESVSDADYLYNQKTCINYIVRTQLYIFTQNSTFGIQLHVSALYVGHRQVVL